MLCFILYNGEYPKELFVITHNLPSTIELHEIGETRCSHRNAVALITA